MTSPTSTGSRRHSIRPASILARSSVSLMSAVSRSPSSMMIPRLSATWRIARSRFGSPVGTAGKTTSSSRRRMSLEKPTTEVSGVRSSWLTLDRKALFVADASSATTRAAWASSIATARAAVRSTTRRSRAAFWDSTSPYSRAFSMAAAIRLPTVYSSGPSPGRTSRPDARLSTASTPTRPSLGHQGGPEERGDLHHPGEGPVALVGILVDMAEEERPVGLVELDQVRGRQVERQAQVGDRGGHLGAATDRPAVGQHVRAPCRPAG